MLPVPDLPPLPELLAAAVEGRSRRPVFRWFEGTRLRSMCGRELLETIGNAARALRALGLERSGRVGILAPTSVRWVLADLGTMQAGGVTVGIYPSLPPAEIAEQVRDAGCSFVFVSPGLLHQRLRQALAPFEAAPIVILLDDPQDTQTGELSWRGFLSRGGDEIGGVPKDAGRVAGPRDLAAIVYTSGTGGSPKGVMLTHANLSFATWSAGQSVATRAEDVALLFLPLAHAFARLCVYFAIHRGTTTVFSRGGEFLMEDFRVVRPHWFASVPRLFEKIVSAAEAKRLRSRGLRRRVFDGALAAGRQVTAIRLSGTPVPLRARARLLAADALALHRVRGLFGGRLRFAISGSAPLDPNVARYLHACGVLVLEGIGMTENASFSHVNRIDKPRFGTVGPPGPGVEARIAEDGELFIRSPGVMRGYWNRPEETAGAIDREGWLQTGDLGEIDDEGFLKIIDRKKDIIVTSGGKNVAPAPLEQLLSSMPSIKQAVVVGDRRNYLVALLVADSEGLHHEIGEAGTALAAGSTRRSVAADVAAVNALLPTYRQIKSFALVPEFTFEDGLLTASAKQRRRMIEARYRDEIEDLYLAGGQEESAHARSS